MSDMNVEDKKKSRRPATCVRFSEVELKRIQRMSLTTGESIPDLLRKALFERFDLERPLFLPEDVERLIVELRRQGNNLNQIAKNMNSGLMSGWSQSFNSLVKVYGDLRHIISVNRGYSKA